MQPASAAKEAVRICVSPSAYNDRVLITSHADLLVDAIRRRQREIDALVSRYTVPIFLRHTQIGGAPVPTGSGVFFRCGEEVFLVTARHVLGEAYVRLNCGRSVDVKSLVLVPTEREQGSKTSLVPLGGEHFGFEDPLDVGVIRLDEPSRTAVKWAAVTLADIDDTVRTDGWFLSAGFPLELMGRGSQQFTAGAYNLIAAHDSDADQENGRVHLLLRLDRNDSRDLEGNLVATPSLNGISGGPVWRLFDDRLDAFSPRLTAVELSYSEKGTVWSVRATWWAFVLEAIRRKVPGLLESAQKLAYPDTARPVLVTDPGN